MTPLIAVLDTNVWLDWLAFADPGVEPLRTAVSQGWVRVAGLPRGRDELADVLRRETVIRQADAARTRKALPSLDARLALAAYDATVTIHPAAPACALVCRDPDDQCFIDLAVAARARWLVTKDRALLSLARQASRRYGVTILPPLRFTADTVPQPLHPRKDAAASP